jgi:hypothetical protein
MLPELTNIFHIYVLSAHNSPEEIAKCVKILFHKAGKYEKYGISFECALVRNLKKGVVNVFHLFVMNIKIKNCLTRI